ncbi:MAG: UxaA family hydrolase, partial [Acidobacteriota bacterium]
MSLIDITKAPGPDDSLILLNAADTVAIARARLAAGAPVRVQGVEIVLRDPVPAGHKVALKPIAAGGAILRYGQLMGRASRAIAPGEHVHTHNVAFQEIAFEYEFPARETPLPVEPANAPVFLGYARADGRVGTRNYIAVVAASNCAAHTAELIARSYETETLQDNVDGVVAFPHGEGCGCAIG